MREISAIAGQLRAVKKAREHFLTLWALESAYDLPVKPQAAQRDLDNLITPGKSGPNRSLRPLFGDDK